jgi:hypothetical protein
MALRLGFGAAYCPEHTFCPAMSFGTISLMRSTPTA